METGIQNQISIGLEGTYGTAVTPTLSLPVNASDGISIKQEVIGVEAIKGTAPKNKCMFLGKQSFEGSYELGVYPQSIGYILLSALGTDTPSTIEAGTVYKHTFSESPTKIGLTVEQQVGEITKRFAGFVANKLKFSAKTGSLVNVNVAGLAKSQADATKITKTYETNCAFNWADIKTISIGGTDVKAKIDSFEIEYDNGVEMFYGLGSVTPQDRYPKQSTVKGKIEAYVDDVTATYLGEMIAKSDNEIIIDIQGATVGSVSTYGIKFTISKAYFNKFETKLGFGYNALSLEFEASEDPTNGLIKIELTNGIASY